MTSGESSLTLLTLTHLLQLRQPLLEIRAEHRLHAHYQAHRLANEILLPAHRPDHVRLVTDRREDEIRMTGAGERLGEIRARRDPLVRLALGDAHRACADFVVAGPLECRARTGL